MKEIFTAFLGFLKEILFAILKTTDWKGVLYKTAKATVLPIIAKKIADSNSKVDDVIYAGVERLIEKFFAPELEKEKLPG